MKKTLLAAAICLLSVTGVSVADYWLSYDDVRPCSNWNHVSFGNGQSGYVCQSWPWQNVDVIDYWDTRHAIQDLSARVNALESELAELKASQE